MPLRRCPILRVIRVYKNRKQHFAGGLALKHAILNRQGREARVGSAAVPGHVALFALILIALLFGAGAQVPPGVSRVYPSTGPETGDVHVRIIGSGFTGATRVCLLYGMISDRKLWR